MSVQGASDGLGGGVGAAGPTKDEVVARLSPPRVIPLGGEADSLFDNTVAAARNARQTGERQWVGRIMGCDIWVEPPT